MACDLRRCLGDLACPIPVEAACGYQCDVNRAVWFDASAAAEIRFRWPKALQAESPRSVAYPAEKLTEFYPCHRKDLCGSRTHI